MPAIDVVHVGSAARDLTEDDTRGWRLGGGATYSALTTALLGLRTAAVIGVDPLAAEATELELLRSAGVELLLVPLTESPVFRNEETPSGRVQGWPVQGHALGVPELPRTWRGSGAWSLVPVASELGDAWASVVPAGAFATVAWQGLLRERGTDGYTRRRSAGRSALLDVADLVGVSRHDLAPGTRVPKLLELLRPGAQLAVTDGHDGGRLVHAPAGRQARSHRWAAVEPGRLVDPTGAGDVFLAALAAASVRPDLTAEAGRGASMAARLEFAAAAASFVVEAPGLHGVATHDAVRSRLAAVRR